MGVFSNFREVIKELKHNKPGQSTIKLCPKCASPNISISSGLDAYPRLYGITPGQFVCSDCGYKGPIVLEQTKEENETV
ncbi:unnamed protein product [marine sediment metagenome]|uniref:Transposase zinc-ribbon domain-containing protein n=1 Tax=marine sediment metagenome TaxID=412755 RepID=X1UD53_9ZZZZ